MRTNRAALALLIASLAFPVFAGSPVIVEAPSAGSSVPVPAFGSAASRDFPAASGVQTGGSAVSNLASPRIRAENFKPSPRIQARLVALAETMAAAAEDKQAQDAFYDNAASAGASQVSLYSVDTSGRTVPRNGAAPPSWDAGAPHPGASEPGPAPVQPRGWLDGIADKIREIRDRLLGRKPPAPPGKGDGKGDDSALSDRVRVTVRATTRAERTLASELGVAIDQVFPDRIEGIAHRSSVERLNRKGLKVLKIQSLEQFMAENFPSKDAPYHDYAEMVAELQALAQSKPELVSLFSIGKSVQGLDIWAVRLNSTEKGTAPSKKPGVVFMGAHHAREHLSVETPLLLAKHLASADDAATKKLLATRDVYIIPMVNPDGAEYDVYNRDAEGRPRTGKDGYQMWRKNRQKNKDGSYGVDLNRNYGYMWNTGGSSDNGRDETYHGPAAFSEPESQAVRDFVNARPNLRVLLSYHTFSELILYPWGHKYDPIEDGKARQVYETMARTMAQWNGYTPEQSSDLYIASGDTTDWSWGEKRIFSFTFELTPKSMWDGGFYPGAGVISSTFTKNLKPALYLIEYADDPYRVLPPASGSTR